MTVMVTGGAGYIGSHVVRLLHKRGDSVVVVDDMSNGIASRIEGLPCEKIDVSSHTAPEQLGEVIKRYNVDSVVHFAAKKMAGESVENPLKYYRNNVAGLANLLDALVAHGVDRLVFSSSALVYGMQDRLLLAEEHVGQHPSNPYGETKLIGEWMIDDVAAVSDLRAIKLRYFNVAGAGWPELADTAVQNLIPIVLNQVENGEQPVIFGDDYPTDDGTCIRDYIHVKDLAEAHVVALDALAAGSNPQSVYNIGTGNGSSVREVIAALADALGRPIDAVVGDRRPGDPARLVADVTAARQDLGWKAEYGLQEIAQSSVEARGQ
ncbi:UDP-glucose 4-epimerase GalE [Brevibacterium sp. UMB10442]|nr:UDP-glucose 4-epimerase GalE [Brevibacterium sp. UMB10442]